MWSSDSVTVPAVCRTWAHADSRPGGTENQEYSGPTMKEKFITQSKIKESECIFHNKLDLLLGKTIIVFYISITKHSRSFRIGKVLQTSYI